MPKYNRPPVNFCWTELSMTLVLLSLSSTPPPLLVFPPICLHPLQVGIFKHFLPLFCASIFFLSVILSNPSFCHHLYLDGSQMYNPSLTFLLSSSCLPDISVCCTFCSPARVKLLTLLHPNQFSLQMSCFLLIGTASLPGAETSVVDSPLLLSTCPRLPSSMQPHFTMTPYVCVTSLFRPSITACI